ncbi:MAG: helix-turn-helix domain-containing protein [Pseudomonadota bacterium]
MDPTKTIASLDPYLFEIVLRAMAAGICLLLAGRLIRRTPLFGVQNLGAFFSLTTAGYMLISSPMGTAYSAPLRELLTFLATMNSVFFWWFATALFDDEFHWRWWRILPGLFMACLFLARRLYSPLAGDLVIEDFFQQAIVISMMVHVIWLAVAHRAADLVEPRRRFRLVFASLVGLTGIVIALAEVRFLVDVAPVWLTTFHGFALLVLSMTFASWILRPVNVFSYPDAVPQTQKVETIDDAARKRLITAMEDGAYRIEGLTIASLGDRIAYPEYKLRRLINQGLGFRNFNAFLNSYRIEEAKRLLADPEKARMQVTQVALDLGYGSIAPFNRAFKAIEGITPSAFRKQALVAAAQS